MLAVKRRRLCTAANAQMSGWSAWGKRQAPELAARKPRPERTWTINSGGAAAESLENPTACRLGGGRVPDTGGPSLVPSGASTMVVAKTFVLVGQQSGGDRTVRAANSWSGRASGRASRSGRIRGERAAACDYLSTVLPEPAKNL